MNFKEIFGQFVANKNGLKVISVGSCDAGWRPNSSPKMLVDVMEPSTVLFLDYKFTRTYANIREIPNLSVSFMDQANFTGYRLTGICTVMDTGEDYEYAKRKWERKLISYEADRIIRRVKGEHSAREAENTLPEDFVLVKFTAVEAAVIKPDRILHANRAFSYSFLKDE